MKRLLIALLTLLLLAGTGACAESQYRFEHVYRDIFIYTTGMEVCLYGNLTNPPASGLIKVQLIDQTDGTVLGEKDFGGGYNQRGFKFYIPKDWTGRHNLALYVDGEKASDDYPVLIRGTERCLKRVDMEENKMAVTIDCGAGGSVNVHKWLALLEKYDAKCTFFITGMFAEAFPEAVADIYAAGHEIGNHSYSHAHMEKLTEYADFMHEIEYTSDILESITGVRPDLFRVPYGEWTYSLKTLLRDLGFKELVQWNIESHDSIAGVSYSYVMESAMPKTVRPGSIVLFHNDDPYLDYLDRVLDYYTKEKGMQLVTVSELMYDNYTIDDNFVMHEVKE